MVIKNVAVLSFKVALGVKIGIGLADAVYDFMSHISRRIGEELEPKIRAGLKSYHEDDDIPEQIKKLANILEYEMPVRKSKAERVIGFR